jgi:hypothetical protein
VLCHPSSSSVADKTDRSAGSHLIEHCLIGGRTSNGHGVDETERVTRRDIERFVPAVTVGVPAAEFADQEAAAGSDVDSCLWSRAVVGGGPRCHVHTLCIKVGGVSGVFSPHEASMSRAIEFAAVVHSEGLTPTATTTCDGQLTSLGGC